MKLAAIVAGWVLVFCGVAVGAVILESLLYRRRLAREEALHRRMGLGAARSGEVR